MSYTLLPPSFTHSTITNFTADSLINASPIELSNNIISLNFKKTQRLDFLTWQETEGYCPPLPPQVYIYELNAPVPVIVETVNVPGLNIGIYYRMSVSKTSTTPDGNPLPKYFANLPEPYFGVVYPETDIYAGYMIVKTTQPLEISLPFDVEALTQADVAFELERIVSSTIAL